MGISKAKEALLFGRKITAEELQQTGFVNQILDAGKDERRFREVVQGEIESRVRDHLVGRVFCRLRSLFGDRVIASLTIRL